MGAALLPVLAAGCYNYAPLPALNPVPRSQVALVLSDMGRVGAGPVIGPGIARIEGAVIGSTESDYILRVAGVTDIRGRQSRWSGESVTLQRAWVGNAYERRFSKPRTYLLVGALTAGFAAFVATRHLFGSGALAGSSSGGGGNQQ